MFVVIYRWRVKPAYEQQFVDAWSEITAYFREKSGSLGSRLHRGNDGLFYGYAQWKSAESREKVFQKTDNLEAVEKMREAIEESFPEIQLEVISDYLTALRKN